MKSAEKRSQAFLRKRKMLLVLPMLMIPFITLAFWAAGGGKGKPDKVVVQSSKGLNLNLPQANMKDNQPTDKLSFYEKAEKDSLKMEEWMRNDPYYKKGDTAGTSLNELETITQQTASKFDQRLNFSPYNRAGNSPEQQILQRLALLEKEMNSPVEQPTQPIKKTRSIAAADEGFSEEVDRLEGMLQSMNNNRGNDPEMQQLDNTLNKILDIQHPQRVKDRLTEKSGVEKGRVYPVMKRSEAVPVSLIGARPKDDTSRKKTNNRTSVFFNGNEADNLSDQNGNAVGVVIHETQALVNGSIVKLRLTDDIVINGVQIPRDNFVFGKVSLSGERLEVEISSIRYGRSLFPVNLTVFDMDGLPGIYIPGAISRDVAKQSADNSLQLMELSTMDPSLRAQATAAGIGAVKNLFSKKIKLVKVTVKAGYQALLRDDKARD